jgi:hypothetical protein
MALHIFIDFENDFIDSLPSTIPLGFNETMNRITFIDFGRSIVSSNIMKSDLEQRCEYDITYFNEHVQYISSENCGKLFNEYIDALVVSKFTMGSILCFFVFILLIASFIINNI